MQAISDALLGLIASRFQVGAAGAYGARVEIDNLSPAVPPAIMPSIVQVAHGVYSVGGGTASFPNPVTPGNVLLYMGSKRSTSGPSAPNTGVNLPRWGSGAWTDYTPSLTQFQADGDSDPGHRFAMKVYAKVADSTNQTCRLDEYGVHACLELAGCTLTDLLVVNSHLHASSTNIDIGSLGTPAAGLVAMLIAGMGSTGTTTITPGDWTRAAHGDGFGYDAGVAEGDTLTSGFNRPAWPHTWIGYQITDGSALEAQVTSSPSHKYGGIAVLVQPSDTGTPATLDTQIFSAESVSMDKSRRMAAAQAEVEIALPNDAGAILYAGGSLTTNAPIRIFQGYGDPADWPRTFTGSIDEITEGRDPRHVRIVARDMMKRLIVQTISLIAPQGADEDGADRTTANFVYLNTDVDAILDDLLDKAGVPTADRNIAATSYAIDEFLGSDGASYADTIIGEDRLTGLTGYDLWADELGIYQSQPTILNLSADSDTDPVPDYSYTMGYNPQPWAALTDYAVGDRVIPTTPNDHYYTVTVAGTSDSAEPTWPTDGTTVADDSVTWEDSGSSLLTSGSVTELNRAVDEYDLKTRVKVRGNVATATPTWVQEWASSALTLPVGIMYVPATPTYIYVLDRGTKKIYRIVEATGARSDGGIWPLYVGAHVSYPRGLSADPADSDRFWVLEESPTEAIHKYDLSDGSHLAEYSLAAQSWTAIKVSASYIWLTNTTTDKIHKHSKADGSSIASYTVTYNAVAQTNPYGVAVDGTTLALFFSGKARFLLVDESDPTTIDPTNALGIASGVISTAGTKIYGGEINTDSHSVLYADTDALHRMWKFTLSVPSTDEVWAEVVDSDLEDELGFLMSAADREHDTHPGDPDHPFEIRRETIDVQKLLTNVAQATETAARKLEVLAHRRDTWDLGAVGNPAQQLTDLIQVTDPVTGLGALGVIDTLRSNMDERGYFQTMALLPYETEF